jgi:soluble lytic murein transglycosylase-like protein
MPNATIAAQIQAEALAQGVPPQIALAVAQQESGVFQYTSNGALVTGSSGEIGVFQLMPATANGLGVNPADTSQNIQGGISLLAQLYAKFGNWAQALSAYNSGSPSGSPSYANSVLSIAGGDPDALAAPALTSLAPTFASVDDSYDDSSVTPSSLSGTFIVAGILGAIWLAWWALD